MARSDRGKRTWILLADGKKGRLLQWTGGEGLESVFDGTFVGEKQKGRDLVSDRPGRTFDRTGGARHAKEPRSTPQQVEEHRFLGNMIALLEDANNKALYDDLVLVAPPSALGVLRHQLPGRLRSKVVAELNKDLLNLPVHDLPQHLDAILKP